VTVTFELAAGGTADVLETDGDRVVLSSTVAAPPGSSLEGEWRTVGARIRIKVRGCRREPSTSDRFRVEGRFVNLSKTQRARLQESNRPRQLDQ
jgi:hypothetical protein